MSEVKQKYSSSATVTIYFKDLGNNAAAGVVGRESTAIDNSTTCYNDILVSIKAKTAASGTAATGYLNVFAYGSENDVPDYMDNVTGTATANNTTVTLTVPTQLRLIGVLNMVAVGTTYKGMFSIGQAFNGFIPRTWGIFIENKTGGALSATEADNSCTYTGITYQAV